MKAVVLNHELEHKKKKHPKYRSEKKSEVKRIFCGEKGEPAKSAKPDRP